MANRLAPVFSIAAGCLLASLCGCVCTTRASNKNGVTVTINGIPVSGTVGSNVATEAVQKRFKADRVTTIKADIQAGNIDIRPVEDGTDEIRVVAAKSVHGSDSEDTLKALLPAVSVQADLQENALVLSVVYPDSYAKRNVSVSVDYTVTVPPRMAMDLSSGSGAITVRGIKGGETLHSDYGNLDVRDTEGSLDLSSSSGSISTLRTNSASKLMVKSDYGSIKIDQAGGGSIEAETESGSITLSNSHAAGIKLHSDYGSVKVSDSSGSLDASSSSGSVTAQSCSIAGSLTMKSEYGKLDASGIAATGPALKVDMSAQSGSVSFHGEASDLKLNSDYGSVNGILGSNLALRSAGLHSSSGSVDLELPAAASARVDASTSSGHVDIPGGNSVLADGDGTHKSVTLGAGAAQVKLDSEYGNVTLSTR